MAQARYGSSITRGRRVDEPGVIVKADERKPTKRELQGAGMMLGGSLVSAGGLAAYNEGEDRAIRSWSANRNADWEKRSYDRMRNRARAAHDAGDRRTAGNLLLSAEDHHGDMMREYRSKAERLGRSGRNFKRGGLATAGAGLGLATAGVYRGNTAGRKKSDPKPVTKYYSEQRTASPSEVARLRHDHPLASRIRRKHYSTGLTYADDDGNRVTEAGARWTPDTKRVKRFSPTVGGERVHKGQFVPTSVLSRTQPMAARVAAITPGGAKPGANAMSPVSASGGAAGKTAPIAGKATNPGQAQPQSAMASANSMGSQKPQAAAASMGSMPVQKASTRTSRRSYDPEDARQRRLGAATATSGIGGALLAREGVRDARRLKAGATGNQFGVGQKLEHAVILDRKAGAKLGGGLAGLATAAQLNAYAHSRRGRRYT